MSQDDAAFDTLITEFSQNIRQIEAVIDKASAAERPEIERKLTDVLASVAHLNPLGDRSAALLDAPSPDGIYVRSNAGEDHLARLNDEDVSPKLVEALKGTGIEPEAVVARLREGAGNAALERQWLAQDLQAIAKEEGFDLDKPEDREDALDRLEAVHTRLGDVLTEARVLRVPNEVGETEDADATFGDRLEVSDRSSAGDGPDVFSPTERQDFRALVTQFRQTDFTYSFSDDPSVRRAGAVEVEEARKAFDTFAQRSPQHAELASIAWDQFTDSRKPQEHAVDEKDRTLHAGDMDLALRDPSDDLGPITEELRTLALYRTVIPKEDFSQAVQDEVNHLRALGASRAYISERSFDIEDQARQDYAERRYLEETAPTVMAFVRKADAGEPISETDRQDIVRQVDEGLTPDARDALRNGDAEALHRFTEDPLRQLELAKTYLQSSEVTAHGPAMERVLDALAEEQIEAQRARHAAVDGEKGITHG